ncbi:MAG: hypothetical protein QM538_02570 [Methylacidiphilales bacterium]|nr:hypothetical protein [Candidatus Methylacidiphilales bacterium]
MINEITNLLYTQFNFTGMYSTALLISKETWGIWSLVTLVIGASWRMLQESLLLVEGQANFLKASKDCLIGGVLVMGYFIFWSIFSDTYSALAEKLGVNNLLIEVLQEFEKNLNRNGAFKKDPSLFALLSESVLSVFAWGFWYISAIMLLTVDIFIRLAHAILYSICAVSGTIIIPLAVLKDKSIVWNWVRMSTVVLLWPLTFGVLLYVLLQSMNTIPVFSLANKTQILNTLSHCILQGIINVMIGCLEVSSIAITQGLVTASSNVASMASPFIAGGVATGGVIGNAMREHILRQHKGSKGGLGDKSKNSGSASSKTKSNSNEPVSLPKHNDKTSPTSKQNNQGIPKQ